MLNDVFGLIYAGEQNMNLIELTSKRALGALPIGNLCWQMLNPIRKYWKL